MTNLFFVQIHSNDNVLADRRLYMTATPRIYSEKAQAKAKENQARLYSMIDESVYGEVLYELDFASAVEKELLTDYKVIVLAISESAVAQTLADELKEFEANLEDAGKLMCCWRALSKADSEEFPSYDPNPMRRAIAYCRTIKESKALTENFDRLFQEVPGVALRRKCAASRPERETR